MVCYLLMWLQGMCIQSGEDKQQDVNGAALAVGQSVTLRGIITSIDWSNTHFNPIEVQLQPNGNGPTANETIHVHQTQVVAV